MTNNNKHRYGRIDLPGEAEHFPVSLMSDDNDSSEECMIEIKFDEKEDSELDFLISSLVDDICDGNPIVPHSEWGGSAELENQAAGLYSTMLNLWGECYRLATNKGIMATEDVSIGRDELIWLAGGKAGELSYLDSPMPGDIERARKTMRNIIECWELYWDRYFNPSFKSSTQSIGDIYKKRIDAAVSKFGEEFGERTEHYALQPMTKEEIINIGKSFRETELVDLIVKYISYGIPIEDLDA